MEPAVIKVGREKVIEGVVEVNGLETTFVHKYDGIHRLKRTWSCQETLNFYIKRLDKLLKESGLKWSKPQEGNGS